jgi:hypothetical protein
MLMPDAFDPRTVVQRLLLAIGAGLFGLVVLPSVFGGFSDPTQAVVWLGLAVTDGAILLAVALLLMGPLASLLLRLPVNGLPLPVVHGAMQNVSRLVVAAVYLVLVQAILRRPLVGVFGSSADPFAIEAAVAITVMLIVSLVLVWLLSAARPFIEDVVRMMLDASLATASFDHDSRVSEPEKPSDAVNEPRPVAEPDTTLSPARTWNEGETIEAPIVLSRAED